jgi:iron(III) transport system substrate-binding protein
LQIKLANDGYAQQVNVPLAATWPRWANWRNTAFALTYEPAVFICNKTAFPAAPPSTRGELLDYLEANADNIFGRIGTYDIERSGVGFMFFSRDQEQYADLWTLVGAMGAAGVKLYSTTSAIVERVADGQFVFGYNILGSYAAEAASRSPDLGIVLPRDYTIVTSRIGLVPAAATNPDLGALYLEFFMSAEGQTIMADKLRIAALNPDVTGENTANAMQAALGNQLRPVPVSPGLMVYLDQVKRTRLIKRWNDALRLQ